MKVKESLEMEEQTWLAEAVLCNFVNFDHFNFSQVDHLGGLSCNISPLRKTGSIDIHISKLTTIIYLFFAFFLYNTQLLFLCKNFVYT